MSDDSVLSGRLVIDGAVVPGRIVLEDGRIGAIEPSADASDGPFISPGFIDVHVHGWGGHDAMGGSAALDGMARALLAHGVTSFLPTAVTASTDKLERFAANVRAWMPSAPEDGAEPLGFNLEGPFLAESRKGAHPAELLRDPADIDSATVDRLSEGLRVITIAPELPGSLELVRRLAGRDVRVSLGHSAASLLQARAGYAAGAVSTTHIFNAMTGVVHRDPGLALEALLDDDVWVELIADRHHVDVALWPLITRLKPVERLLLVSDAISLAGSGRTSGMLGELEVRVDDDRVSLVVGGNLAGSVIALDTAVRNMVQEGSRLAHAVLAACGNPAQLLGARDRGRISVGLRADLVELDENLHVRRVMRHGEWLA